VSSPQLSSLFGHDPLADDGQDQQSGDPLSDYFGQSLLGADAYIASPDDLLAENIGLDDARAATQAQNAPPPDTLRNTRNEPNTVPAPPGAVAPTGDAAGAIDAAMAVLGRPYVWGGTFAGGGGGDCSGLLYYAFNKAGIAMPRYRAVDYGHMGAPVSTADARPGDIVYFDNPGDVDHVGIYVGNGQFIESPQPGSQVQISGLRKGAQIRRILPDSAMAGIPADDSNRLTFHTDNTVFTAGPAPAEHPRPPRDPNEQLNALDAAASLEGIEGEHATAGALDFLDNATPESIFGQAAAAASRPFYAPAHYTPSSSGSSGGSDSRGGQRVGAVSGLSADEAYIIQHESGGDPTADNPTSTAFGIWQGLQATRADYAGRYGFSPDTTDVNQQLVMFRAYVRDRYGSAGNARRFWERNHWY
jgi:cell wall-associated NlpC family hydrolase